MRTTQSSLLGLLLVLGWSGSGRAQPAVDCVRVEERVVQGMFLCGLRAELRVALHDECDEAVVCRVAMEGSRSGADTLVALEPGERAGSLVIADRRRVERGTTGCYDAAPPAGALHVSCVAAPATSERPVATGAAPSPLDRSDTPPVSPLTPATRALDAEETLAISALGGATSAPAESAATGSETDDRARAERDAPPPEPAEPLAIRAADPGDRALDEIALTNDDSAYRGASWHVRYRIGVAYDAVPVIQNGRHLVADELVTDTSRITAHALGLTTRFLVAPYGDDVVAIAAFVEGALGALAVDGALSFVATGWGGLELALGYRWLFALLDVAAGGRAAGIVSALDVRNYEARGGLTRYGLVRVGGGARICLASTPLGGCPAALDLTAHWERLDMPLTPYAPTQDALLFGVALGLDDVAAVTLELAWGYPAAGDAILEPRGDTQGWRVAVRVEKQFDWFGTAYDPPRVECDADSLTGVWATPDGDRVLLEERDDVVFARSVSAEGIGRLLSGRGPGAPLRIEWLTDRGRVVDRLVVAGPDELVRDGVTVLERVCE